MREIKFRAWIGNKMEYQVLVGQLGAFFAYQDPTDSACANNTKYSKDTPIMQFTGLHDNTKWMDLTGEEQLAFVEQGYTDKDWKGKEIYESDQLKCEGLYVTVVWENGGFHFISYDEKDIDFGTEKAVTTNYEIIGNRFENPELLENL